MLRVKALIAIPVILGLTAASADAQLFVFPTWETQITLTQQDLDMIHNAVDKQVHAKPVGTRVTWSNPASGNSGTIKLLRKFVMNRQHCEEIRYEARSKGPPVYTEHYHFTSCLQPDGTWKIA